MIGQGVIHLPLQLLIDFAFDDLKGRFVRGGRSRELAEIEVLGNSEMDMDQFGHLLVQAEKFRGRLRGDLSGLLGNCDLLGVR